MQTLPSPPADAGEVFSFSAAFDVQWRDGQLQLAPTSSLNPTGQWQPLLDLYEESVPLPPTPEEVVTLLGELLWLAPPSDVGEFEIQAATLRAAARQYFA